MIRVGSVWDSTVEVIRGRAAILASIAMLTLFVPAVLRDAALGLVGAGAAALGANVALGIALFVLSVLGTLAIVAVASDPAVDRAAAFARARATLADGVVTILAVAGIFLVLLIPGMILLAASGFDVAAAAKEAPQPDVNPGVLLGGALYLLVAGLVMIWAGARLALLYPVLLNERVGVGAIRRSFAATRGLTLRIVAVILLYLVVFMVLLSAATSVSGIVFRLALGPDHPGLVGFLTRCVSALVATGGAILQTAFTARLYAAVRGTVDAA